MVRPAMADAIPEPTPAEDLESELNAMQRQIRRLERRIKALEANGGVGGIIAAMAHHDNQSTLPVAREGERLRIKRGA